MDKWVGKDKYLNIVSVHDMVSVAVPFGLAYALDHGYVKGRRYQPIDGAPRNRMTM